MKKKAAEITLGIKWLLIRNIWSVSFQELHFGTNCKYNLGGTVCVPIVLVGRFCSHSNLSCLGF